MRSIAMMVIAVLAAPGAGLAGTEGPDLCTPEGGFGYRLGISEADIAYPHDPSDRTITVPLPPSQAPFSSLQLYLTDDSHLVYGMMAEAMLASPGEAQALKARLEQQIRAGGLFGFELPGDSPSMQFSTVRQSPGLRPPSGQSAAVWSHLNTVTVYCGDFAVETLAEQEVVGP